MLHHKQQGSALLTALFIMTLVAIVSTAISLRLQLDIYRTQIVVTQDKLFLASQAVSFWAIDELINPAKPLNKVLNDGSVATFPIQMQSLQKDLKITGALYDLQAQFNLNNLNDNKTINTFINLIQKAIPKLGQADSARLVFAVMNWISDYDPGRGKDVYAGYYASQKPPYYTSHQMMQSKTELRLVKDITAAQYLSVEPFFTVLPKMTPVNINTASKEVLMSLGNGISAQKVHALLEARASKPITKLDTLNTLIEKIDLPADQITIESTYFLSQAKVRSQDHQLVVYTLFERSMDKNKKRVVSIVRVSINQF